MLLLLLCQIPRHAGLRHSPSPGGLTRMTEPFGALPRKCYYYYYYYIICLTPVRGIAAEAPPCDRICTLALWDARLWVPHLLLRYQRHLDNIIIITFTRERPVGFRQASPTPLEGDCRSRRGPTIALNPAVFPDIWSYLPIDNYLNGISRTSINIVNAWCGRETVCHCNALFLSLLLWR
jgi:hypothetical protein